MTRAILCLLLLAAPAAAQGEAPPREGDLEVLSYNVHGLPAFITLDDTFARQSAIGPLLEAFDVVGIQEDFMDEGHARLLKAVTHAQRVRFGDVIQGRLYGSGLTTLARPRVALKKAEHYTTFSGVLGGANDGLASKGFQMVRLTLAPGVEVDVYNSHLDAGGGKKDAQARAVQVEHLRKFMGRVSAGRAVLFLGDTNLKPKREKDAQTLRSWLASTGLTCACKASRATCCGRIDRVLYRSGAGVRLRAVRWGVAAGFQDARRRPLSDHKPIAVTLRWRRRPL